MQTRKHFPGLLLSVLLGLATNAAFSETASTPDSARVVLSSGLEGGGYWNAGDRLQSVAGGMGLDIDNQASTGSLSNLKALAREDSPVALAFAQADALQYFLGKTPGAAATIETLADIGRECVFIIADSDGDIKTIADIVEAPRLRIGIKSPNSGIRVTWDYMATLIPDLRGITMVYGNAVDMMTEFTHPLTDIEKVVMVVHDPDARSPEIDMVVASPDEFRFVEIDDQRLTRAAPDGASVYDITKVKPGAVADASAVETICVQGLLVANSGKLSPQQRTTLMELIASQWGRVTTSAE